MVCNSISIRMVTRDNTNMDLQKLTWLVVMVVIQLVVIESHGHVCKHDTNCGTNQCCYIKPEFMVVSRRQLQPVNLPSLHRHNDTGVCENYRVLAEHCNPMEKLNNHCGCGAGMNCQWVPQPTTAIPIHIGRGLDKRKLAFHTGPGAYQCA